MLKRFLGLSSPPCWSRTTHYIMSDCHLGKHSLPILARHFSRIPSEAPKQAFVTESRLLNAKSKNVPWRRYFIGIGLTTAAVAYGVVSMCPRVSAAVPPGHTSVKESLRTKYNFIADVVEKVSPAVVFIKNRTYFRQSSGSGFIISSDGLIITNAHVVQSAKHDQVEVELPNGKKYIGEIQVVDPASDLALLKINDTNLPTLKLASSESLRPGEWVVAVGSPLSLTNTVTSGIVSSTARKSSDLGLRNSINYIQTDAFITHGNSGGPLINLDGEAVGVNSMKVTEGICFAIPSDYVKTFLLKANNFKKEKEVRRRSIPPYIGIAAITLTPHLAAQLRNRVDIEEMDVDRGVFVVDINSGSPAQQAGITKYDIIMKVDDKAIDSFDDLINAVKDKNVAKFTLYRDGNIREVHVRPRRQDNS